MIFDETAPGVVVSPHLDDAVLSAWSRLCNGPVVVVNVCTALPPTGTRTSLDRLLGFDDSVAIAQARRDEDAAALAVAGCNAIELGYLDQQYRATSLETRGVRDLLDTAIATARWLCAPAAIGSHPDHLATREAALAIAHAAGIPISLYADQPYATQYGWPHWVNGTEPRPHLVPDARWPDDFLASIARWDDLVPRVYELAPDEVACKQRALACYRTQFHALNAGPFDRLRHPEVASFELHWDVP